MPISSFRYRAMHYSAKRGLAIACHLSVCLSVCDIGGSWPHRLKILETNCANNLPNIFAHRSPRVIQLLPGEHWEILGRLEAGLALVRCFGTASATPFVYVTGSYLYCWIIPLSVLHNKSASRGNLYDSTAFLLHYMITIHQRFRRTNDTACGARNDKLAKCSLSHLRYMDLVDRCVLNS